MRTLLAAIVALVLSVAPVTVQAQQVTGFKTGETTTSFTKQCYYNVLGSIYVKNVSSVSICPLTVQVRLPNYGTERQAFSSPLQSSFQQSRMVTGFKVGERTTGLTKLCYYNALGSAHVKTVSSISICPLTVRVRIP